MQIKKTDWIGRPEKVMVRSHSLTFKTDKRCAVLYTLEETGTYQVLAAFYEDVSLSEDGVAFPFYEYTDLRDDALFQEYIALVEDRALYSTGVTVESGEQLLTLSTCSYNTSDERFVVVAERVAQ